jgi:hypothetical protein
MKHQELLNWAIYIIILMLSFLMFQFDFLKALILPFSKDVQYFQFLIIY